MATLRGGLLLIKEIPTGAIDGVNTVFTTSKKFIPGTLQVFLNGLPQHNPLEFVELSNQSFQLLEAPIGGIDPDTLSVTYQRA